MSNLFSRVLWVLSGILLVVAGIFAIANPAAALTSLAFLIGLSMLISGVIDIVIYARGYALLAGAGWILADGILTVILSLFLLFKQVVTAAVLPFVFGMWIIFTGVSRAIGSFDLKRLGVRGWGWFLALGIVLVVLGLLCFCKPLAAAVAIGILVGVVLILEGAVAVMKGLFSARFLL